MQKVSCYLTFFRLKRWGSDASPHRLDSRIRRYQAVACVPVVLAALLLPARLAPTIFVAVPAIATTPLAVGNARAPWRTFAAPYRSTAVTVASLMFMAVIGLPGVERTWARPSELRPVTPQRAAQPASIRR